MLCEKCLKEAAGYFSKVRFPWDHCHHEGPETKKEEEDPSEVVPWKKWDLPVPDRINSCWCARFAEWK